MNLCVCDREWREHGEEREEVGIGWVCFREVSGTLGRKGRVGTHKRYHCLERMSVEKPKSMVSKK